MYSDIVKREQLSCMLYSDIVKREQLLSVYCLQLKLSMFIIIQNWLANTKLLHFMQ